MVEEESPTDQKCRNEEEGESSSACAASEEVKGQGSDSEIELPEELLEEEESGRVLPTDGYWVHYKSLCEELPGREKQVELLLTLLGKVSQYLISLSLFVYSADAMLSIPIWHFLLPNFLHSYFLYTSIHK